MSPEMVSAATRPSPLACLSTQHRCTLRNRALRKVSSVPQRATPTTRSTKRAAATPALSKPICQSSDRLERPSSKLRAVGASAASAPTYKKVLVLGGSGYVGSEVCRQLLSRGYTVVSVSRRGTGEVEGVDWRAGDVVADPDVVERILAEGGFDGVMHTIGMLLEGEANKFASGSGSVPTPGSTYDQLEGIMGGFDSPTQFGHPIMYWGGCHEADRTRCCERFRGRVCEDTTARAIAVRVRVGGGGGLDAGIEPNMSLAFLHNALDKHDQ
eukprot:1195023-Prorocentrum_minimum.AAC.3